MNFRQFATDNARSEFGVRYDVCAEPHQRVHRITRWTAVAADETPWCGRVDNTAMVNRTMHGEYVTCPDCLANTEIVLPTCACGCGSSQQHQEPVEEAR